MRVPIGRRLSGLGQSIEQPPFVRVALENSEKFSMDDEVRQAWGRLAVSDSGNHVVRFVRVTANDTHYAFLPDDQFYAAVFPFYGADSGKLTYIPMNTFKAGYRIVRPEAQQLVMQAGLPLPDKFESSITVATFAQSVMDGLEFANVALVEAQRGNPTMAKTRLNIKGAGAAAMLEKANIELGILLGLGVLSQDQAADFGDQLVKPLANVIAEARGAIIRQESFILAAIDMVKSVAQGAVTHLKNFAGIEWDKFTQLYVAAYKAANAQKKAIANLERVGGDTLTANELRDGLVKIKALISGMDSQLRALGANVDELRAELNLEAISGVPAVIAKILVGIGSAFTVKSIAHAISTGLFMGFGTVVFEKFIMPLFRRHESEVQEYMKTISAQNEAQKRLEAEKRARGEKTDTDKAIERIKVNLDSLEEGNGAMQSAPEIFNDPVFNERAERSQHLLDKAKKDAAELGVPGASDDNALWILGGAAAAIGLAYYLYKNKE